MTSGQRRRGRGVIFVEPAPVDAHQVAPAGVQFLGGRPSPRA